MSVKKEIINNDIKFLAKSSIRLKILDELNKKPQTIKELVDETEITYSSVSSNLNKLEKEKYITKTENIYYITPLSEIYFKTLIEFNNSVKFLVDFNEFWSRHNINQINNESLRNINDLKDSRLIQTNPLDIYKTHNVIKKQLQNTHNLKAIFPYVHPEYPELVENILRKNGSAELVINDELFNGIIGEIEKDLRKKSVKNKTLKVHTIKDILNIHLTICDENMTLGLFKSDGSFDQNRIITSSHQKSMDWANNLFEEIRNKVI